MKYVKKMILQKISVSLKIPNLVINFTKQFFSQKTMESVSGKKHYA